MEHWYDVRTANGNPDTGVGKAWNVFDPETGGQFMPHRYTSPQASGI
jgi:hypothetical protein